MRNTVLAWRLGIAITLLGAAAAASAMTIGRIRGAVVLGQPLNLSVPMTASPGEDARSLCLAAEILSGETPVDASRVHITMDGADASGNAIARIRTGTVISEAFVTVNFRAGCAQSLSRQFVLLVDVVTETVAEPAAAAPVVPPVAVAVPPAAPAPPAAATPAAPPATPAASPRADSPRSARPAVARPARTEAKPAAPAQVAAKPAAKPAPKKSTGVAQPRLKLDPVEAGEKRPAGLRPSTELSSAPSGSPEKSAEAAAMWRALNAPPEEALKEEKRVLALEAEVKSLRDLGQQNQALLAELNARLQKAEEERRLGTYFYLVVALLVLTLALIGVLWVRLKKKSRAAAAWWEDRDEVAKADMRLRMVSGAAAGKAGPAAADVDLDLAGGNAQPPKAGSIPSPGGESTVRIQSPLAGTESGASSGPGKSSHPEEVFDIRQQADFFISLGQTDQAISLLSNHIRSNEDSGPWAYLDLLRIYHSTGNVQEYESLRSAVVRVFNVEIPEFSDFGAESRSLDSYAELMASVQAEWGSAKAVRMLEELIYRRPGSKWNQAFGLTAYRDLLALHAVAKEVSGTPIVKSKRVSGFGGLPTASRPMPMDSGAASAAAAQGLDLDLGGMSDPAVVDISAYESESKIDPSMAETLPARLEDRPGARKPDPAPAPDPEPPGNLLDFDVVLPPRSEDKPKT